MNEMKMKAKKTRNELKASDSKTYSLKNEERWRTTKNLHGFAHGNVSKAIRKHLSFDFLHGNNFFHPKQLKFIARGMRDIWNNPLLPIYRKNGEEVAAKLAQASCSEATLLRKHSGGIFWRAQMGLGAICTPIFTKYTPCLFLVILFS